MLVLRKRKETKTINCVYEPYYGESAKAVRRSFLQQGCFFEPYHYFIDQNGETTVGRENDDVGSAEYQGGETSIMILVDAPSSTTTTPKQTTELNALIRSLKAIYKGVNAIHTDGLKSLL